LLRRGLGGSTPFTNRVIHHLSSIDWSKTIVGTYQSGNEGGGQDGLARPLPPPADHWRGRLGHHMPVTRRPWPSLVGHDGERVGGSGEEEAKPALAGRPETGRLAQ